MRKSGFVSRGDARGRSKPEPLDEDLARRRGVYSEAGVITSVGLRQKDVA